MKRDYVFCSLCGSKGGFVNQLLIIGNDENAIVECEWCAAGATIKKGA